MQTNEQRWINISEAARILQCSRQHVSNLIKRGTLQAWIVAERVRLRREDVEALIRPVEPVAK